MRELTDSRITHIINQETETGKVTVPDDAFAIIACFAALEAAGVHSIGAGITTERIPKLGFRNMSGVKVEVNADKVKVYLAVCIDFGYNIPQVAKDIQDKVKNAIENMTSFSVSRVHIKVSDIYVA